MIEFEKKTTFSMNDVCLTLQHLDINNGWFIQGHLVFKISVIAYPIGLSMQCLDWLFNVGHITFQLCFFLNWWIQFIHSNNCKYVRLLYE